MANLTLPMQLLTMIALAVPVASVAWTVTHEEIFSGLQRWLKRRQAATRNPVARKFFYLFTCEYCFSHWVTLGLLLLTGFRLVLMDWRGFIIAGFSIVWVANVYMSLFGRLRLDIKHERNEIAVVEKQLAKGTPEGQRGYKGVVDVRR